MKERPILFNGAMVRAILAGTKTQTRRLVKYIPALGDPEEWCHQRKMVDGIAGEHKKYCPHGLPGNLLWVKETCMNALAGYSPVWFYRADSDQKPGDRHWRPSIFCTRAASRITLEITAVRIERLNDISEADAKAEGSYQKIWITSPLSAGAMNARFERGTYRDGYKDIWESINGPGSWAANPWVWVINFIKL